MDAPYLNCDGCRGTTGRAGCPVHRDPIAPKQAVYTDEVGAYHYTGSTLVMTHCRHGLDLRLYPRCYLCHPAHERGYAMGGEPLVHGYTCDLCEWGRDETRGIEDYAYHLRRDHCRKDTDADPR